MWVFPPQCLEGNGGSKVCKRNVSRSVQSLATETNGGKGAKPGTRLVKYEQSRKSEFGRNSSSGCCARQTTPTNLASKILYNRIRSVQIGVATRCASMPFVMSRAFTLSLEYHFERFAEEWLPTHSSKISQNWSSTALNYNH